MKMRLSNLILGVSLLASASATASVHPDFVLAKLEPLPQADYRPLSGGMVDSTATLDVTYWIQPCAGEEFDQFVVTRSQAPDAMGRMTEQMRVGVLMRTDGIMCMGPMVQETRKLTFQGPFNLPHGRPEIKPLR